MPTRLVHLVTDAADAADLAGLARFWAAALGWTVAAEEEGEVDVWPDGYRYRDPVALPLVFALGAVRADIGQGRVSWTVLADPEGSEFCLLSPL